MDCIWGAAGRSAGGWRSRAMMFRVSVMSNSKLPSVLSKRELVSPMLCLMSGRSVALADKVLTGRNCLRGECFFESMYDSRQRIHARTAKANSKQPSALSNFCVRAPFASRPRPPRFSICPIECLLIYLITRFYQETKFEDCRGISNIWR